MDTKALSRVEIKNVDEGRVTAVFATLDVVDSDQDITVDGAFENGAPVVISSYGHSSWSGSLPVGKGTIRVEGKEAILDGQFFLDTAEGLSHFKTVQHLAEQMEWSYGYDPLEWSYGEHDDGQRVRYLRKLAVHEVSPVLKGAGVGTRTLGTKGALRFSDEIEQVLVLLDGLVERTADVMAMRREKGKQLGADTARLLERVKGQTGRLAELLQAPIPDPTDPGADDARAELLQAAARFEFAKSRRRLIA